MSQPRIAPRSSSVVWPMWAYHSRHKLPRPWPPPNWRLPPPWSGAEATPQSLALAHRLVALVTDPTLPAAPPALRAAAGRALARLGDPREGVGTRGTVPHLAWCTVPAGPFLMGANANDKEAYDREKLQ